MKHFSLMIGAIVALVSCSKSDDVSTQPLSGDQTATFTIEAPATRAAVTGLTRYIVEAYENEDLASTPVRTETTTGTLTLTLKKNTLYKFLFWADNGTVKTEIVESSGYYNTSSLQAVTVSDNNKSNMGLAAYCLAVSLNTKDFKANYPIMLKNATAKVIFVEGVGLQTTNNTLKVTYAAGTTLNVGTGEVSAVTGAIEHTFTDVIKVAAGAIIGSDYILAPMSQKSVLNIKVQFNSEPEKTIDNVPFQQSYKTNIKGEYSNLYASVFTIGSEVDDYTGEEVEFPGVVTP